MAASFKILIITWSANGIRFCETLSETEAANNRSNVIKRLKYADTCQIADFFPELGKQILTINPSVVVFGFTDEAKTNTYFHSDLLPKSMQSYRYTYVSREKADETTSTMRISVYAQNDSASSILLSTQQFARAAATTKNLIGVNSSAVAVYLSIPSFGTVALILAKIKDDTESIVQSIKYNDPIIRKQFIALRDVALGNIIRSLALQATPVPDHVFVFGKLNYRLTSFNQNGQRLDANAVAQEFINSPRPETFTKYVSLDELRAAIKQKSLYNLQEGVNDAGPIFRPTCNKRVGRPADCQNNCYVVGENAEILPAWCTRILFFDPILQKNVQIKPRTRCIAYSDFDYYKTMSNSGDAGVYGVYEFVL